MKTRLSTHPIIEGLSKKCQIVVSDNQTSFLYESLGNQKIVKLKVKSYKCGANGNDNSKSVLYVSALTGEAEDKTWDMEIHWLNAEDLI